MPKKLTTEEFIAKARAIHGDKYDYSKVVYKNNKGYVTIICPVHGEFTQRADSHLEGYGCSKCGEDKVANIKRKSTEEFIAKAKAVHSDRYNYSKVNYKGNKKKVIIVCPKHGEFSQTPAGHLQGRGCPGCANEGRREKHQQSTEDFIKKAKAIHGDKYNYSSVDYVNSRTKVKIICPEHGEFEQKANNHLRGYGCTECAIKTRAEKARSSTEEFIAKARAVHGDKYDYSKVEYVHSHTDVIIICPIHGEFPQTPNIHLKGQGCPQCSELSVPDNVYLLVDSDYKPTRMKIGVTSNLKMRLKQLRLGNKHAGLQPTPFKIFKRACYEVGPGKAYEIEQVFHRYYASRNLGYTGFDGATEWFEYDESAEKILGMVAGLINAKSYNKK